MASYIGFLSRKFRTPISGLTTVVSFFTIKSTFLFIVRNDLIIKESFITSCLIAQVRET